MNEPSKYLANTWKLLQAFETFSSNYLINGTLQVSDNCASAPVCADTKNICSLLFEYLRYFIKPVRNRRIYGFNLVSNLSHHRNENLTPHNPARLDPSRRHRNHFSHSHNITPRGFLE
jgi:hypothetical protein